MAKNKKSTKPHEIVYTISSKSKTKKTRQGHSHNRKWGAIGSKMWITKGKKYRGQGK